MREEWEGKVQRLFEDAGVSLKVDEDNLISPELKIKHKKSGLKYTVDSVGPEDIILRTPEGEQFLVDKEEFGNNYELD